MNNLFCPLPWITVSIRNDGVLRVCCNSNQGPNRGELHYTVDDIEGSRNCRRLKEFRKQILNNEWPEDCIRCKKEYESGITARFQYEAEAWSHVINKEIAEKNTNPDGSIDTNKFPLIYYDIRLGNKCNLLCRYCNSWSSSAFGQVEGDYHWYERRSFWDHLDRNIDNVQLFHVEGGEPLLAEIHFDFLEKCVENDVAKNIKVEYTTSLTTVPKRAWELWKHFKEARIGVSMDGIEEVFNYIRYPSKFSVVNRNLHRLDKEPGNYVLWIACTVSTLNIWYLPEFFKWKLNQSFDRVSNEYRLYCSDHPLHTPIMFNIKCLTDNIKQKVSDHLMNSLPSIYEVVDEKIKNSDLNYKYRETAKNLFEAYIHYMNSEDYSKYFKNFIRFNDFVDDFRNQSMKESMPEWYEILRSDENE